MFIRNCLTKLDEITVLYPNTTVEIALNTMQELQLASLPVINENKQLVGIISKENIMEYLYKQRENITFSEFKKEEIKEAIRTMPTLSLDDTFEATLPIIVRNPFVPIIDTEQKLIGIIKRKSVTEALESAFGVGVKGVRILIGTTEGEGLLNKILEETHKYNINVIAAVSFDSGEFTRRIMLKVKNTEHTYELINHLEKIGFRILSINEE